MLRASQCRDQCKRDLVKEQLRNGNQVRLQAFGTSMLPIIWPGDHLTIDNSRSRAVGVGDVVLVSRADRFFIHRVTQIVERNGQARYKTRGDAVAADDFDSDDQELLGKILFIERRGRVVVPNPERSPIDVLLASLMRHSDFARNIALRVQRFLQRSGRPAVAQYGEGFSA